MDDMVLWDDDLTHLRSTHLRCQEFLHDTLSLELKPEILQRTANGVDFLGCRIWPTHVKLNRRSKRRLRRRIRLLERAARLGLISESVVMSLKTGDMLVKWESMAS